MRHAAVCVQLDRPASTWELTDEGRLAAGELAKRVGPVPRVLSSPEPKAIATAEPFARLSGVEIELDERLREVERTTNLPTYAVHRAAVRAYLEGTPVDGWEPRDQASSRFGEAVDTLDGAAVVTHATVLALHLGLTFAQWERIALPDVIEWRR